MSGERGGAYKVRVVMFKFTFRVASAYPHYHSSQLPQLRFIKPVGLEGVVVWRRQFDVSLLVVHFDLESASLILIIFSVGWGGIQARIIPPYGQ